MLPESSLVTVCVVVVVVVVVVVTISVPKSSSVISTCTSSVIVTPGVQSPASSIKQVALEKEETSRNKKKNLKNCIKIMYGRKINNK